MEGMLQVSSRRLSNYLQNGTCQNEVDCFESGSSAGGVQVKDQFGGTEEVAVEELVNELLRADMNIIQSAGN